MKRRVVLSLCLLGIVGGTAGAALAAPAEVTSRNHNVCLQFAQNQDYRHTTYLCIDTP